MENSFIREIVMFAPSSTSFKEIFRAISKYSDYNTFYSEYGNHISILPNRAKGYVFCKIYIRSGNWYNNQDIMFKQLIGYHFLKGAFTDYKNKIDSKINGMINTDEIIELLRIERIEIPLVETEWNNAIDFTSFFDKKKGKYVVKKDKLFFLKCSEYIENLTTKYQSISTNESPLPEIVNIEAQEKFVYCHELGIIDYLREIISKSGRKQTQKSLYLPLCLITGISQATIKRLMQYSNNPESIANGNPFNNSQLMERVKRNLYNNYLNKKD